jgi:hypothetical protein
MRKSWLIAMWFGLPVILFYLLPVGGGMLIAQYLGLEAFIKVSLFSWAFGLVASGIGLYALRRSARLAYGIVEVVVSLAVIAFTFERSLEMVGIQGATSRFLPENIPSAIVVAMAAVYVMVRGLDNVGEGLKPYPQALAMWEEVFPSDLWNSNNNGRKDA